MEFEVTEVKLLRAIEFVSSTVFGKLKSEEQEYCNSLSLRLEAVLSDDPPEKWKNKFTIHAVVPWYIAGQKPPRIGDRFKFEQLRMPESGN